jgi:thiamine kinase-like enzyme
MKDKLKMKIDKTQLLNINEKQKILDTLDKENFKQNLCHGDFQFMNLMQTSNDIKIIDWVDSSSGNNEADICRTYLLYKVSHEEIAELYIENYCVIANISKENILKWVPIIAAARLSEGIGNDENEKLIKIVRENI